MQERLRNCQETDSNSFNVVAYQNANVSVPVTIKPRVQTGDINIFCCGEPVIKKSSYSIRYRELCESDDPVCNFVISQNICIEIPIEFYAKTILKDPSIECRGVSAE